MSEEKSTETYHYLRNWSVGVMSYTGVREDVQKLLRERDSLAHRAERLEAALADLMAIQPIKNELGYLNRGIGTATPMGRTILAARSLLPQSTEEAK